MGTVFNRFASKVFAERAVAPIEGWVRGAHKRDYPPAESRISHGGFGSKVLSPCWTPI